MKRRELLKVLGMTAGAMLPAAGIAARVAGEQPSPKESHLATPVRALVRQGGSLFQVIALTMPFEQTPSAIIRVDNQVVESDRITRENRIPGSSFELLVPPVESPKQVVVSVEADGNTQSEVITLQPVRKVLTYILPMSHHDLGYTDLQEPVEERQIRNITRGMELARITADYPEGSRFVWNLEVLWAADLFMQRQPEVERAKFLEAIRTGQVALNGSYANQLTGLCRPEELLELFRYGTLLGAQAGVKVDSAMMSDVPGYTWGTVVAMAQAGIRYFSAAPNYFDRIGTFMVSWQDKPFWWVSPSGKEKVLVWVPWTGYAMSHINQLNADWVTRYQNRLDDVSYPYDISHIRWSGHGDNAVPDPELFEFVRSWNETFEWPRFSISSTSTAFAAMEQKHGAELPSRRGDLTPYWEDGAGSSALETAINRNAADRLTQAEALTAMLSPASYDPSAYSAAWRDVLLYSEHTWGAWCSVSDSESPFTKQQWAFKREFAVQAEQKSNDLLAPFLHRKAAPSESPTVNVYNSTSWDRTEVVLLPRNISAFGDHVTDSHGGTVPSQRLSTGELAVLVTGVPAFGCQPYTLTAKPAHGVYGAVHVHGCVLENRKIRAVLDPITGDLVELRLHGVAANLVDRQKGPLNQYLYMEGKDLAHLGHSGPATLSVEDNGPLIASVRIESAAPGCNKLVRHIRLAADSDVLEISNLIDKKRVPLNPNPGKKGPGGSFAQSGSKESVQFGFPLSVENGKFVMDIPLATMRPEVDQLPGSCKNWLPVGRWIDISSTEHGVTWATLDAPLVELGGMTATMLGSQRDPSVWRKHIEPTQAVYSWVMNNHWGTNYLAYQQGPVTFRYALRLHHGSDLSAAHRFAIGLSQPLLVSLSAEQAPLSASLLRTEPAEVLVLGLKPSRDGKAWIARLYESSGNPRKARLVWGQKVGKTWSSNLAEDQLGPTDDTVAIAGSELITLRIERI